MNMIMAGSAYHDYHILQFQQGMIISQLPVSVPGAGNQMVSGQENIVATA
jgi:hypothetical protein